MMNIRTVRIAAATWIAVIASFAVAEPAPNVTAQDAQEIAGLGVAEEEALHLEKIFTDTVINSMPGIFYVFDDRKQLIRWNKRLEDFSGRLPERMPTMRPHDFVAKGTYGLLESKLNEVFVEHRNADAELLLLDREEREIPFYCTGSPMTVGDRTYLVGLGIDMSVRRRTEEALRESDRGVLLWGIFGQVEVSVLINRAGEVVKVCATGEPILARASESALSQWRFQKDFGISSVGPSHTRPRYAVLSLIFDFRGQSGFRELERQSLDDVIQRHPCFVMATGGSLVSEPGTFERLVSSCFTVMPASSAASSNAASR